MKDDNEGFTESDQDGDISAPVKGMHSTEAVLRRKTSGSARRKDLRWWRRDRGRTDFVNWVTTCYLAERERNDLVMISAVCREQLRIVREAVAKEPGSMLARTHGFVLDSYVIANDKKLEPGVLADRVRAELIRRGKR